MLSKKYQLLIFILAFLPLITTAQSIVEGTVSETVEGKKSTPVVGANIYWLGTTIGTTTDEAGMFSIEKTGENQSLIVSYIGYRNDTILIGQRTRVNVVLDAAKELDVVTVEQRREASFISTVSPTQVKVLTGHELTKAACCNLSESFETDASVSVSYTDAVTGAKEIRMLGLEGKYTQLMVENIPSMRGLATTYGLLYIPGPWMESIHITKGTGSVLNGYEAMTGQINVELQKPDKAEKFYINLYGDQFSRSEINLHSAFPVGEKLSTLIAVHGNHLWNKIDDNGDGFMDMPMARQLNLYNRWNYSSTRFESQFGVKGLVEERLGGHVKFNEPEHRGTEDAYGFRIDTRRGEAFLKTGFLFPDKPYKSIGIIYSITQHEQSGYYGVNDYSGKQTTGYINATYQSIIDNSFHQIRFGTSLLYDRFDEDFRNLDLDRTEVVPGIFSEYSYMPGDDLTLVTGLRLDYHNLYGMIYTPRVHFRYQLKEKTTFRTSAGRGFRVANILSENSGALISSRDILVLEKLRPEISWTFGGSISHQLDIGTRCFTIVADYYRTEFENRVVADMEHHQHIMFYNLKGRSYSNSVQFEVSTEIIPEITAKTAYKLADVWTTYSGITRREYMEPQHYALLNLSYLSKNDRWKLDFTTQWHGKTPLPDTSDKPENFRTGTYGPDFFIMLAQLTHKFRFPLELYLGSENLGNFTQKDPIIAPEDPFGPYFDASMAWGPVVGRKIYGGLRYSF